MIDYEDLGDNSDEFDGEHGYRLQQEADEARYANAHVIDYQNFMYFGSQQYVDDMLKLQRGE